MNAPKKWTKKDLAVLCSQIDTFYLVNRPLSFGAGYNEAIARIREAIANNRKEIVLAGIRSSRATISDRYRSACETIGNQLVRFTEYGKPDEIVDRFIRIAREEDAGAKHFEAILHRVLEEGLPPEVEAYDPTAPKGRAAAAGGAS